MLAGMEFGLPVVDADTMGRVFPEAQMASFATRGLSMAPLAIADIRSKSVLIPGAETAGRVERIGRKTVVELGSIAGTCAAPRPGREVKDLAVLNSVSHALRIGNAALAARRKGDNPVDAVLEAAVGALLFIGKVQDVDRRRPMASWEARRFWWGVANSRIGRWRSTFRTSSPSPAWMDASWPADPIMKSAQGLAIVGPRAFGFDFDYTTVAEQPA